MASTSAPAQAIAIDRDLVEQIVWDLFSVSDWLYDTNSTVLGDLADWLGSTVEEARVFTHELWTLGRVTHRLLKSA